MPGKAPKYERKGWEASKKSSPIQMHLTVIIGREGLDTHEMDCDSNLPASWLMSEIIRKCDEQYHVIGLEKKNGTPIDYDEDIGMCCSNPDTLTAVLGNWKAIKEKEHNWNKPWYTAYTKNEYGEGELNASSPPP